MSELLPRIISNEPLAPLPSSEEELARCLADHEWRLFSGCLYKIMVKGDDEAEEAMVMPFRPNRAQRRFVSRLWHRNLILKARQLGFTSLVAILWLDHALFNSDQRCGIIAQDRDAAKVIFRDKVKFAYNSLPEALRERFPLAADNADELFSRTTTAAFAWQRPCVQEPSTACTYPSSGRFAQDTLTRPRKSSQAPFQPSQRMPYW